MHKDKYTIAEISKFANISKQTLRYYDSIGLFSPSVRDEKNGYRYYEYSQIYKLNQIMIMKGLGLSLEEIITLTNKNNLSSLKTSLLKQQEIINSELYRLQKAKSLNDELLERITKSEKVKSSSSCYLKTFPQRHLYALNFNFSMDALYDSIKTLYTSYIKGIGKEPQFKRGEVVLQIDMPSLLIKKFDTYSTIGFFVDSTGGELGVPITNIPESRYAITHHIGEYHDMNKSYKQLYKYIKDNNLKIIGKSIEFAIISISTTDNPSEFITEIQIPVE